MTLHKGLRVFTKFHSGISVRTFLCYQLLMQLVTGALEKYQRVMNEKEKAVRESTEECSWGREMKIPRSNRWRQLCRCPCAPRLRPQPLVRSREWCWQHQGGIQPAWGQKIELAYLAITIYVAIHCKAYHVPVLKGCFSSYFVNGTLLLHYLRCT